MKQFLIINLVVWLGWLSHIALAQLELSGAITGSVSFPHVAVTCIGNLAAFVTCLLRRRFDLEMGARDFMATLTDPGTLKEERENDELIGITCPADCYESASVVMLTRTGLSNSSIRKFMKYIYHAHNVKSVLLKYDLLKDAQQVANHQCNNNERNCCCNCTYCNCIVFPIPRRGSSFTGKLARYMPGTLKKLCCSSLYLLPCLRCQDNGCPNLVQGEEIDRHEHENESTSNVKYRHEHENESTSNVKFPVKFPPAVCDALDFDFAMDNQKGSRLTKRQGAGVDDYRRFVSLLHPKEPICICIPVNYVSDDVTYVSDDVWTKLLVRCFKSKDKEEKGVIVMASDALQSYLDTKEEDRAEEVNYRPISLIVPRLLEILLNLLLTVLFKVDGFSSSIAARRAVRSYVVDSKGNGLPANVFLTKALVVVKTNSVCQVLKFRGNILCSRTIVGFFNLASSITWAVLVALGGTDKWYAIPSMAPSKPRVVVIIVAIVIVIIVLDIPECFKSTKYIEHPGRDQKESRRKKCIIVVVVIVVEMAIAVVAGIFGLNKGIGRWIYSVLEVLVWIKWIVGSYLLGVYSPEYVPRRARRKPADGNGPYTLEFSADKWDYNGTLVYSSAFLLNAVLAGVRGNWAGVWDSWK